MKVSDAIAKCYEALMAHNAHRATKYISPSLVVKITRKAYFGGRRFADKNARQQGFALTVGKPNYAERKFIKDCAKSDVKFPVRNVQITLLPKRDK